MAERTAWDTASAGWGMFGGAKEDELEETLNQWGEQGWEVVSVLPRENSGRLTAVARRALSQQERRRRSRPA